MVVGRRVGIVTLLEIDSNHCAICDLRQQRPAPPIAETPGLEILSWYDGCKVAIDVEEVIDSHEHSKSAVLIPGT